MTSENIQSIATKAVHNISGEFAEHAHLFPIFATSTFTFDSAEQGMKRFSGIEKGFTYSRFGNPTTAAAAEAVAELETFGIRKDNGEPLRAKALLTSSGQAAMVAMFLSNLSTGDRIVCSRSVYGGTYEFLSHFLPRLGIECIFTDMGNLQVLEGILSQDNSVRLLHLETPANPTMQCIDIEAVCKLAKQFNKIVCIDNTFATSYLQQPFRYGVDYIFHSTTKFLNGHGSAVGGVLIGKDLEKMDKEVYTTYKLLGGNANPFDAFMLLQGIKTLAIRMEAHCDNAEKVARFLEKHPAVEKVHYNGLPSHPDYVLSVKQMKRHGAVLSFELKSGFDGAVAFINKLRLCTRAVSLGTTDTLISHPASMSHAGMSPEERLHAGITDGMIRMSVGIEGCTDILNDLEQALRPQC